MFVLKPQNLKSHNIGIEFCVTIKVAMIYVICGSYKGSNNTEVEQNGKFIKK